MVSRCLSFLLALLLCFGVFRLTLGLDHSIAVIPAFNELSKLEYDLTYLIYLTENPDQSVAASFLEVMYNKMASFSSDAPDFEESISENIFLSFFYTAFNYLTLALDKVYYAVTSVGSLISDSYANLKVIFKAIAILIS